MAQRLIGKSEAAEYCGCSVSCFASWVAKGLMPKPLNGTRKWDKRAKIGRASCRERV